MIIRDDLSKVNLIHVGACTMQVSAEAPSFRTKHEEKVGRPLLLVTSDSLQLLVTSDSLVQLLVTSDALQLLVTSDSLQ